jgi:pimeloyl-ACP methyl ester carboxylesterase
VIVIGQSRGGVLAKALGARRPDLVSGIVTLGAPTVSQLSAHPFVLAHVMVVGALGTGRVPGMFRMSCLRGACCEEFRRDLVAGFPPEVAYTALYSKTDGIVDWRACLDPAAELIEVRASHIGMGLNAEVYAEVGHALGRLAREDGEFWAEAA